jgi:transposase
VPAIFIFTHNQIIMTGFLGIDVSKGYSDFALIGKDFHLLEDILQLDDTRKGHDNLSQWLECMQKKHRLSEIHCAVESTGGLENNWFARLVELSSKLPLKIARLNPSVVKRAAQAQLNANVTDALSATNIATYLVRYGDKVDYTPPDNRYSAYRSLFNHISLLNKQKTQIINEMKQLLYVVFPELQRFCKQAIPHWVLELLEQYPTRGKLSRAKPSTVAKIKGITLDRAKKLIEKANESVGSRGYDTDGMLIRGMAMELAWKQKHVEDYKAQLAKACVGTEVALLETIKGVGSYSASAIMIQIENIERFPTPRHLASYFGLNPKLKISGDKKAVSRMSKQGRPEIRAILYMCAHTAVRFDDHMKNIYANHRAKGMVHKQAIGVIMHKLLRVIWGMLSGKKAYDATVDKANQELNKKDVKTSESKEIESKRRLQSFDEDAPISRKATKKRKVHLLSQFGDAENVRDPENAPAV